MRSSGRHRSSENPGRCPAWRARGSVYLLMCVGLLVTAVLLVGGYFAQASAPPAPPGSLGAIPAAAAGPAVSGPAAAGRPAAVSAASAPAASTGPGISLPPTPTPVPNPPPPFSMASSPPVAVRSSATGIDSNLLKVGLNADGSIEVPTTYSQAAWYSLGPTPGALGPAVIIGHVDSYRGPGVFFNLGATRPGQMIAVTRADGTTANFRVDAVNSYTKDQFPTDTVYGPINYAGLRLITCGGTFDKQTRSYDNNTVVFASLVHP